MMVRKCKEIIKLVSFALYKFRWDFDACQNFVVSDLGSFKICLLLSGELEWRDVEIWFMHGAATLNFSS